jgi:hypothetical protein
MSTTEQRTGFRLPWGGDTHRAEGEQSPSNDEQAGTPADAVDTTDTTGHAAGWPSTDTASPAATDGVAVTGGAEATPSADPSAAAPAPAVRGGTGPIGRVSKASSAASAKPRRENPLVAGLVKAMREAAETARSETSSRVAAAATAQVETIHASSAEEAEALKRRADEEITEIRDWSKAEMARIREETDRRISRRREDLGEEIDAHAASVERRIDAVRAAVAEFEVQMGAFFEKLMQEDDPAMLATLAEQMPEPPELDEIVASAPATPAATLDESDAAAAEAEALALLDAEAEGGDGSDEDPGDGELIEEATVAERLAMLTTPPHGEGEAAADTTTRVTVVGLISVASISVFKRSLAKLADVRSVSVSSGPDGDFIFAVVHGPATDLRTAIPGLSGFEARITAESEDGLTVVARDPEA